MSKSGLKRNNSFKWSSASHDTTYQCGQEIASLLPSNCQVCIVGDLGAGKTTLCKGIINKLTSTDAEQILSPTYSYVRSYDSVHHFDCYRINSEDEFLELGLEDLLTDQGIKLIEWPDRIESLILDEAIWIHIDYESESKRTITLQGSF